MSPKSGTSFGMTLLYTKFAWGRVVNLFKKRISGFLVITMLLKVLTKFEGLEVPFVDVTICEALGIGNANACWLFGILVSYLVM